MSLRERFVGYAQRPRPRWREQQSFGVRETLLWLVLGPGALTGSMLGLASGRWWPDALVLPISLFITLWMFVWLHRPVDVDSRRDAAPTDLP